MIGRAAAVAAACLVLGPASASAASLYAVGTLDDAQSDGVCDASSCTLRDAVAAAADGDTVWLLPGVHELDAPVSVPVELTLHGPKASITPASGRALEIGAEVTLEDLTVAGEIDVEADAKANVTLRRVAVTAGGLTVGAGNATLLESSTVSGSPDAGIAVAGGPLELINSTVSGNGGLGVDLDDGGEGASVWHSTIAGGIHAELGGRSDVSGTIVDGGCSGDLLHDESHNLDSGHTCGFSPDTLSIVDTPAALGPLETNGGPVPTRLPAAGSAAVDSGGDCTTLVTRDARGVARPEDGRCDIGAVELEPPTAITQGSNDVTARTATIRGGVDARYGSVGYRFEYGPAGVLGWFTPDATVAVPIGRHSYDGVPVSAVLEGLEPGVTYEYRVVAETPEGTTRGALKTFTTGPAPPAVGDPPVSQPPPAGVRARLTRLHMSPRRFRLGGRSKVTFRLSGAAAKVRFRVGRRSVVRRGEVGSNAFEFRGRIRGRRLRPGRHRLTATVGGVSRSVAFRLLPRR